MNKKLPLVNDFRTWYAQTNNIRPTAQTWWQGCHLGTLSIFIRHGRRKMDQRYCYGPEKCYGELKFANIFLSADPGREQGGALQDSEVVHTKTSKTTTTITSTTTTTTTTTATTKRNPTGVWPCLSSTKIQAGLPAATRYVFNSKSGWLRKNIFLPHP